MMQNRDRFKKFTPQNKIVCAWSRIADSLDILFENLQLLEQFCDAVKQYVTQNK